MSDNFFFQELDKMYDEIYNDVKKKFHQHKGCDGKINEIAFNTLIREVRQRIAEKKREEIKNARTLFRMYQKSRII